MCQISTMVQNTESHLHEPTEEYRSHARLKVFMTREEVAISIVLYHPFFSQQSLPHVIICCEREDGQRISSIAAEFWCTDVWPKSIGVTGYKESRCMKRFSWINFDGVFDSYDFIRYRSMLLYQDLFIVLGSIWTWIAMVLKTNITLEDTFTKCNCLRQGQHRWCSSSLKFNSDSDSDINYSPLL